MDVQYGTVQMNDDNRGRTASMNHPAICVIAAYMFIAFMIPLSRITFLLPVLYVWVILCQIV